MFRHSQEPITDVERRRLEGTRRRPFISRRLDNVDKYHNDEQKFVDVYQASVLQCFIPNNFNEELPLYLLDLGGMILVLFGQWMFDPHTLIAPNEVFEAWNCDGAFFRDFSVRCHVARGTVLSLAVDGTAFVEARRLPSILTFKHLSECQLVAGHAATLIGDLEKSGLIETA